MICLFLPSPSETVLTCLNVTKALWTALLSSALIGDKDAVIFVLATFEASLFAIEINFEYPPDLLTINYTSKSFKNFNHYNLNYYKENIKNNKLYILTNSSKIELWFVVNLILINPSV